METKLNNELLRATDEEPKEEKRKKELIEKIVAVARQSEVTLDYSNTALNRMTKQQLNEKLAEVVEIAMRNEMAQVGAKPGAADSVPWCIANATQYCREGVGASGKHVPPELRLRNRRFL